jgi:hypothetical protein
MTATQLRDEFYLFTMPGDMCPVWAEMFGADGTHVVAPTPYSRTEDALSALKAANPGATVDELCLGHDIDNAREWARTMPLEQIEVAR